MENLLFAAAKKFRGWGLFVALSAAAILLAWRPAIGQESVDKPAAQSSDEAVLQFADAVNFQNGGKFGLAADEYADFLKRYPSDPLVPKAWHYLAVCQLKQQKYDESITASQKALAAGGEKFELAAEAYLFLGLAHYHVAQATKDNAAKIDHLTKAAAALGTVATKFPKSPHAPQALYYNAEAHYAAGRKAEAVKAYEMLLDEHPKSELVPSALYGLGFALEELGSHAEAGKAYDTFLKNHATHELAGDVTFRRGETLIAEKKFAEAKPFFAKAAAIENFPQADQALMQQASCAYELKQYDEAAALYLAVPERFAQSTQAPLARMNAGKALLLLSKFAEARAALAALIDSGNADIAAEAAHLVARCLIREKKPAEAADVAARALAKAAGGKWAVQLQLDAADATFDQPEKRKTAVDAYLALVKAFPDDPLAAEARFMAAYASLQTENSKQAQSLAEDFLKRHADHVLAPEAAAVLAESRLLERDFAGAEKQFRDLIAKFASHREAATWQRRLGYTLLLAEQYPAAIEQLAPLVATTKDADVLGDVNYWLATSYFKQQAYDKALKACESSIAAAPEGRNADRVLLIVAECQAAGKDFAKAIAAVERIAAKFPSSPLLAEAAYRAANYTARSGKPQEAIALYQKMLSQYGESEFAPYAIYGIGLAQSDLKDHAAAEKAFTTLIEKHPNHALAADARYDRAAARQFQGRFEEAAADAQAVLAAKPSAERVAAARHILGLCQDRLKKPDDAVKTYQALLKDAPNYPETAGVLYELGWSLRTLKRDAEARQTFARLATEFGDSQFGAEAHYLLGEYHFADKAYDKALAAYEAATKAKSADALAEKIAYRTGWAHYRLQQYDKAQAAFQKQLGISDSGPLAAEGLFMLGESYFQQNKFAEALPAYDQALAKKLASKDFEVLALLHAGQCASQAKRWTETIATLDKLVASYADSYYLPEALYEQGWAKRNLADEADAKGDAAASKLYDEALEKFDAAGRKTTREVGARSRFMMGEICFLRKNYREAIRNYYKVAEGYPNAAPEIDRWKAKAAFSLGHVHATLKQNDEAKKWFQTTIERYPTSEEAALAKERLGKSSAG
ncbi:MAG: hypothetical protein DCC68_14730 [Planctomycetota bacterium]|nr:MAG: hypothetical protein DCC68_14730 [Planctomycetota bacterium]